MSKRDLEKRVDKLEQKRGGSGSGDGPRNGRSRVFEIVEADAAAGNEQSQKVLSDYNAALNRILELCAQHGIQVEGNENWYTEFYDFAWEEAKKFHINIATGDAYGEEFLMPEKAIEKELEMFSRMRGREIDIDNERRSGRNRR